MSAVGAAVWWRYALTCTVTLVRARATATTWPAVLATARDNISYVAAFSAQLENPAMVTEEMKEVRAEQDGRRSYDELKALREISVYWVERKLSENSSGVSSLSSPTLPSQPEPGGQEELSSPTLQRWFPLWGGWYSSPQQVEQEQPAGPVQLEEFLQDAIKEDTEVQGVSHKDVVFSQLSVQLTRASIQLVRAATSTATKQTLFEFEFQAVEARHESRPRTGGALFSLRVGAVHLRDQVIKATLKLSMYSKIFRKLFFLGISDFTEMN